MGLNWTSASFCRHLIYGSAIDPDPLVKFQFNAFLAGACMSTPNLIKFVLLVNPVQV